MSPQRIQLRRTKGWRKPEGAIVVARPTKWGNPFRVGAPLHVSADSDAGRFDMYGLTTTPAIAVELFRLEWQARLTPVPHEHPDDTTWRLEQRRALDELRGHDLACWCPLDQPCHAEVLLELANAR